MILGVAVAWLLWAWGKVGWAESKVESWQLFVRMGAFFDVKLGVGGGCRTILWQLGGQARVSEGAL